MTVTPKLQEAHDQLAAQVKALVALLAHRGTLTTADAYGITHLAEPHGQA